MIASRLGVLAAVAAALGMSAAAPAAIITFSPAQTISGPSDVKTNGTVIKAYDFNNAGPLTISGVNFVSFPSGGDTQSGFDGTFNGYGNAGQTGTYATLLTNGIYHDNAATSITLTGLTIGTPYQVEVFVNDSRNIVPTNRTETISGDTGGTPGSVQYAGSISGQYIVGTFTANATTQTLNFNSVGTNTNNAQINGLVLESLPEPASLGLLAVGGLGLLARRRRV